METKTDVERNVDAFLQVGDLVGASFICAALALLLVFLFVLFQSKSMGKIWRVPVLIGAFVPLIAALNVFFALVTGLEPKQIR